MARLRRLGPDDWETFREIRLRALADAPDAFGSTLEREQAYDERAWRQRLSVPVVVVEDPGPVAVAGTFDHEGDLHVWGMWTDPEHRGRGHARAALDALLPPDRDAWLDVSLTNLAARAAYERYGFVGSGTFEPLRPGSDQMMEGMILHRD